MSYLFNTFLYFPLLNTLVFLYNTAAFYDLGIAIIITTVIVRFIVFPIYQKTIRQQVLSAKMAPELSKIQKEHKDDKERQTRELLELYKKYKVNPFYAIFALVIQLPIFLAVWKAIGVVTNSGVSEGIYSFITNPGQINHIFLGLIDLSGRSIVLIIIAAAIQFAQIRLMNAMTPKLKDAPPNPLSGNQLAVMMTGITLVVLWNLPSAMALYWVASTAFSIAQQWYVNISIKNEELKGNNK